MKQTKIFWGFLLLIITLVTGCSKEDVGSNDTTTPPNTENKITLRASTGSGTRIGFEEATDKINLIWKETDKFALYDTTGKLAATFTLIDGKNSAEGIFETGNALIYDGASYTACYPAIEGAYTLAEWEETMKIRQRAEQTVDMSNSDPMAHLSDVFGMSQNYTYNASNPALIKFNPHYAMLTLEIAKPTGYTDTDVPTVLRFVNGLVTTAVTLTNFPTTWEDSKTIKVYALILPSAGTNRTLTFSLDGEGKSYARDISSSIVYKAGNRYTAKLENTTALMPRDIGLYYQIGGGTQTLWNADTFKNALTNNSTVFISTVGSTKMSKANYMDLLNVINSSSRTGLTLDFSGAKAEENTMVRVGNDFTAHSGIKAVSGFPVGITSLEYTFRNFSNLTSVAEIPNSVTNMNYTFRDCKSFNHSITIGNSVTDMIYTFTNCYSFNQPITIPNSVTNMNGTFYGCSAHASTITIYGADSLDRGWIFGYVNTENIDLILGPNRASEWTEGGNTWAGYTFKSITSTSAE